MKKQILVIFLFGAIFACKTTMAMQELEDLENYTQSRMESALQRLWKAYEHEAKLVKAIEAGDTDQMEALIMEGVEFEIQPCLQARDKYADKEFRRALSNSQTRYQDALDASHTARDKIDKVLVEAQQKRVHRDEGLRDLHTHFRFMPATVVDLILSYKP